jgi:hypothetical protein
MIGFDPIRIGNGHCWSLETVVRYSGPCGGSLGLHGPYAVVFFLQGVGRMQPCFRRSASQPRNLKSPRTDWGYTCPWYGISRCAELSVLTPRRTGTYRQSQVSGRVYTLFGEAHVPARGYAEKEGDARQFHPKLRPPVNPRELEIDPRTGMKVQLCPLMTRPNT